jgi:hypothetical protein
MTSFSKLHKVNRQLIFSPQAAEAAPVVPARPQPLLAARPGKETLPDTSADLLVRGQGTVVFKHTRQPAGQAATPLYFTLGTAHNRELVRVELADERLRLVVNGDEQRGGEYPLLGSPNDYIYYWFSLNTSGKDRGELRFGVGEARLETLHYAYRLTEPERLACLDVTTVYPGPGVELMRLLRDPVVATVPLEVRGTELLTMADVAHNRYLPAAALPEAARQLYGTIAGPSFELNTADFPEFAQAIKYSIENEKGWCFQKLEHKRKENAPDQKNRVYLRITLGQNGGESPGIPFVMEIWPPQCYSAVHQHAGANAVIRVLHGSVQVSLFPYLQPTVPGAPEPDGEQVFGKHVFEEGAITWISPVLNQIHRLRNLEPLGGQPCVTIQCYQYDADDTGHYPFFDYDKIDGGLHQFEPDSDMDFLEFKATMQAEWAARPAAS